MFPVGWGAEGLITKKSETRISISEMKFLFRNGKMHLEGWGKETRTHYKYHEHETVLDITLAF